MIEIIKHIVFVGFIGFSCSSKQSSNEQGVKDTNESSKDSISNEYHSDLVLHVDQPVIPDHVSERIIDEIYKLPEIQERSDHIDSITDRTRGLSVLIDKSSDSIFDYYIQIGYSSELRLETFFHLYVDTLDYQIMIEDILEGDIIDFDTWRKREQNK